jgi:hypothetical protein
MLRTFLKKILSKQQRIRIRKYLTFLSTVGNGSDLTRLAKIYGTDKASGHFYTRIYQHHFGTFRKKKIKLLEIGVGGYDDPNTGGESLRTWKRYFPFSQIYAIDIFDKSPLEEKRITIFKGSQDDHAFLEQVHKVTGDLDLIIDDGSHVNKHVISTFEFLFPRLKDGGIYVIEDTQTSYWEGYGGSNDLKEPGTLMNFFKNMADALNNKEFIQPGYRPSYYDKKVVSVHFYHNLIFIYKGNNDEPSNIVIDNNFNSKTVFKWG